MTRIEWMDSQTVVSQDLSGQDDKRFFQPTWSFVRPEQDIFPGPCDYFTNQRVYRPQNLVNMCWPEKNRENFHMRTAYAFDCINGSISILETQLLVWSSVEFQPSHRVKVVPFYNLFICISIISSWWEGDDGGLGKFILARKESRPKQYSKARPRDSLSGA